MVEEDLHLGKLSAVLLCGMLGGSISFVWADERVHWRYAGGRPVFVGGAGCALSAHEELRHLNRRGYDLCFAPRLKSCVWVAYALTPSDVSNQVGRIGFFKKDDDLRDVVQSPDAYAGTGYDRGHMAPAQDMQYAEAVSRQSFWMGNIMPQRPLLNRGEWKRLEGVIHRKVVPNTRGEVAFRRVYVMAGPIFTKEAIKQYERGESQVLKPARYWKIVKYGVVVDAVVMDQAGDIRSVTVSEISRQTGLEFFPDKQDDLRTFYLQFRRPIYCKSTEKGKEDEDEN